MSEGRRPFPRGLWGTVPALLALLAAMAAFAAPAVLSDREKRGKRIYTEGTGSMPVHAFLPGPGIRVRGRGFPCIQCHRTDGKGVREGGVRAADITQFNLTKEYGGPRASGRTHPPYTDAALRQAITNGWDPAGTELNAAHPRYALAREDLDDLVAYLKVLGDEPVPGITAGEVRVGGLLPAGGPLAETAADVERFLSGFFSVVNGRGGLYARKVRFIPVRFDPAVPGAAAAAAREIVAREDLFCLVANLGVPVDDEAVGVLGRAKVPVIAPLMVAPEGPDWTDGSTFYIHPSYRDQARVMVDYAADSFPLESGKIAIVHVADRSGTGGAAGAREQAMRRGITVAADESYGNGAFEPAGAARRVRSSGAGTVLFFGGGEEIEAFLAEGERLGWAPRLLASAAMAGKTLLSLPQRFSSRVALASPSAVPEEASREWADFVALSSQHGGTGRHGHFLAAAYAGALLVEKGLTITGRGVTRERFLEGLGRLHAFRTGVTPPLSYDENRRVGARGASILAIDGPNHRFVPALSWREAQ